MMVLRWMMVQHFNTIITIVPLDLQLFLLLLLLSRHSSLGRLLARRNDDDAEWMTPTRMIKMMRRMRTILVRCSDTDDCNGGDDDDE